MRTAQLISTGIYLVFMALATVLFHDGMGSDVTAIIVMVTLTLTWSVDVNQVIAYASRAFALFYMLQCLVAFALGIPSG